MWRRFAGPQVFLAPCALCLLWGAILPRTSSGAEYTIIGRFGQRPADAPDDRRYGGFWDPTLTSTGKVALYSDTWDFHGSYSFTNWTPVSDGIWFGDPGALDMIVESGRPLPGLPADQPVHDEQDWHWTYAASGDYLSVMARVTGPGVTQANERVYLRFGPDGAVPLYRDGMQLGDATLKAADPASPLPDGRFAFNAYTQTASDPFATKNEIWGGAPGDLRRLAEGAYMLDVNDRGQLLYSPIGVMNSTWGQLWQTSLDDPNNRVLIAETGMALPGAPNLTLRLDLGNDRARLSNSGDVLMRAYVEGLSLPAGLDKALIAGRPGDLWTVLYPGMPAPEIGAGWTFGSSSDWGAALSNSGSVAVGTRVFNPAGESRVGLWYMEQDQRQLIAVEGQAAPGLEGATFASLPSYDGLLVNGLGQVVFSALVAGPQFSQGQDASLWLRDIDGSVRMLLREGDILHTPQGDVPFDFASPVGFNDAGQLLLMVNRFGFDQALVLTSVPVPEPSSLALGAAGILVLGVFFRARKLT